LNLEVVGVNSSILVIKKPPPYQEAAKPDQAVILRLRAFPQH